MCTSCSLLGKRMKRKKRSSRRARYTNNIELIGGILLGGAASEAVAPIVNAIVPAGKAGAGNFVGNAAVGVAGYLIAQRSRTDLVEGLGVGMIGAAGLNILGQTLSGLTSGLTGGKGAKGDTTVSPNLPGAVVTGNNLTPVVRHCQIAA